MLARRGAGLDRAEALRAQIDADGVSSAWRQRARAPGDSSELAAQASSCGRWQGGLTERCAPALAAARGWQP
jgi:hypothetical protein